MSKLFTLGLVGLVLAITNTVSAEEITFTTYYPAPYGVYRDFQATRNAYFATEEDVFGNLVGNVGIGTTGPTGKLHVDVDGDGDGDLFVEDDGVNKGNVGIGTTEPDTDALLEMSSTTKGFLPPRMTTTQRDAIATAPTGLLIYNTTTNAYNFYNGTTWTELSTGGGGVSYMGLTDTAYTGDGIGWTIGAWDKCDAKYPGSRMCNVIEMRKTLQGSYADVGWMDPVKMVRYSDASPIKIATPEGNNNIYTTNYYSGDCGTWNTGGGSGYYGLVMKADGVSALRSCGSAIRIHCCK